MEDRHRRPPPMGASTMSIERRAVLKGGTIAAGAAVLGGPFQGLVAAPAAAALPPLAYRGLRAVPDERDGKVRLHVPPGFRYRSFHDTESQVTLGDGTVLPGRHDGMARLPRPDRRARHPRAQPRGQRLRTRVRPARRPHLRPDGPRRLHRRRRQPHGGRQEVVDRHQRHDGQLLRRPDAVGHVDDLRGDRQRSRRRPRPHRRLERRAHQAARLRLRGARRPAAPPPSR